MKKKIIIGLFLLLILITATIFIVGAISSYNYEITNHTDDKWLGFGAVLTLIVGGFIVFYELDLFYTVYYFLVKPKATAKSILNVISNLTLLIIFFSDDIAHFLYCGLNIFNEEWLLPIILFFTYTILRILCIAIPVGQSFKEE